MKKMTWIRWAAGPLCALSILAGTAGHALSDDANPSMNDLLAKGFSIVGTEGVDPVRVAFFLRSEAEVWSCIVSRMDTPGVGLFHQAATGCHPVKTASEAQQIAKHYNLSDSTGRISRVAPDYMGTLLRLALETTLESWAVTLNLTEPDAPATSIMSVALPRSDVEFKPRSAHIACVGDEAFLAIKYQPKLAAGPRSEVAVARARYKDVKVGEFVMRAFDRLGLLVLSDRDLIEDLAVKAKGGAPFIQLDILGATLKGTLEVPTSNLWQAETGMQTKCLQPIEVE